MGIVELKIADLIFLYRGFTQLGVDEHRKTLSAGKSLRPIEVTRCIHDGKLYVRDGNHSCYVRYYGQGQSAIEANVNDCIGSNWMYGFSDSTCDIRELYEAHARFCIDELTLEAPHEGGVIVLP